MTKAIQSNSKRTYQSKVSRSKPFVEIPNYYESYRLKRDGMNEERALSLSNQMIEWYKKNPSAITFESFFNNNDVNQQSYYAWKREYECLRFSHGEIESLISERRELEAKEKDNKFLSNSMHLYSHAFREDKLEEHKRKLELKAAGAAQTNINNTSPEAIQEVIKQMLATPTTATGKKPEDFPWDDE